MKKPRLDRFDPKHRIRPETLDFSGVPEIKPHPAVKSQEKAGSPTPKKKKVRVLSEIQARTVEPSVRDKRTVGSSVRVVGLENEIPRIPEKRKPERYAFQFWEDQIIRLKRLRHVLNISKGFDERDELSLSDLMRQAVDEYIKRQTRNIEKGNRTNVRTDETSVRLKRADE